MLNKEKALNWRKFLSNSPQWDFRTNRITPQGNSKSLELKKKKVSNIYTKAFTKHCRIIQMAKKMIEIVSECPSPNLFQRLATAVKELLQLWATM